MSVTPSLTHPCAVKTCNRAHIALSEALCFRHDGMLSAPLRSEVRAQRQLMRADAPNTYHYVLDKALRIVGER